MQAKIDIVLEFVLWFILLSTVTISIFVLIVGAVLKFASDSRKPKPPTDLTWRYHSDKSLVELFWRPSISDSILQELQVIQFENDQYHSFTRQLPISSRRFAFVTKPGTHFSVSLVAYDGDRKSNPAVLHCIVPEHKPDVGVVFG